MSKYDIRLLERLGRLVSLTQALLDNAGRFGHVGDQTDCDALLSEHLRRSESVTELELMAMQRAIKRVLSAREVDAKMLSRLLAARDHASSYMLGLPPSDVRAPMNSGSTD